MGRELAALALAQLAAWEHVAREWPLQVVDKDGSWHLVCAVCETTLIPVVYSTGVSYTITHNVTLAALVAHLRNVHRLIESEVYRDGRQDTQTDHGARGSRAADRGHLDSH